MERTRMRSAAERDVLLEGLDDYVGLWELVGAVRDELGPDEASPDEIRRRTLELASDLLAEDLARPGFPTGDGDFDVLEISADTLRKRISRRWDELGREPDVGDIVWFRLTEKGREAARVIETA